MNPDFQSPTNQISQSQRLLNMYMTQYNASMRQVNLWQSDTSRIRMMIDNIVNDIRSFQIDEERLRNSHSNNNIRNWRAQYGNNANPNASANTNQGNTYANYSMFAHNVGDSSLNNANSTPTGVVDPSFNDIGYPRIGRVIHDSSFNNVTFSNLQSFFSNVPVAPSIQQINNAVTIFSGFDEIINPINDVCPISLKPFEPNEIVSQINHCGHIFCNIELTHWLTNNVRCPVCRYDIRDTEIDADAGNDDDDFSVNNWEETKEELPELEPAGNIWTY